MTTFQMKSRIWETLRDAAENLENAETLIECCDEAYDLKERNSQVIESTCKRYPHSRNRSAKKST